MNSSSYVKTTEKTVLLSKNDTVCCLHILTEATLIMREEYVILTGHDSNCMWMIKRQQWIDCFLTSTKLFWFLIAKLQMILLFIKLSYKMYFTPNLDNPKKVVLIPTPDDSNP